MFWVSKGRYEDLKVAHKREVDILVSWIEQLQVQINSANSPRQALDPTLAEMPDMGMYLSDIETDLIDARENGLMDESEFQQAMQQVKHGSATIG